MIDRDTKHEISLDNRVFNIEKDISLYEWQSKCLEKIRNRDAVISAPTGSGKTIVAYQWSGIISSGSDNTSQKYNRVIFTAPIKALTNERYMNLLRNTSFSVGIETGDFKKNEGAYILCCTHEIYTLKYAKEPNQAVIVDEFHYVFDNPSRTRPYIEGIIKTHPSSKLLLMSATFGDPCVVMNYLNRITSRDFELFTSDFRPTKLVFNTGESSLKTITNALVFVFSMNGVHAAARLISSRRKKSLGTEKKTEIRSLAKILSVSASKIPWEFLEKGVGIYYGNMFPKERIFMETLFRNRYIDVLVGTDALALGVNLPAENVIFAQLAKYYEGPISYNSFLQMGGRAGRKMFYDTGYISYINLSKYGVHVENREHNTQALYTELLKSKPEPARIDIHPDIGMILRGETTLEEESDFIADYSLPKKNKKNIYSFLKNRLLMIRESSEKLDRKYKDCFTKILPYVWYSENSTKGNFAITEIFSMCMLENYPFENDDVPVEIYKSLLKTEKNKNELYLSLHAIRYFNFLKYNAVLKDGFRGMPSKLAENIQKINIAPLIERVNSLDSTVFSFEEKMNKIFSFSTSNKKQGET